MANLIPEAELASLNSVIAGLQRSARNTLPMFALGILATLLAAGIAVYYIINLSADLREARAALRQSQTALTEARTNLVAVQASLRQAQSATAVPANADRLAAVIADVSNSQKDLRVASSSITQATAKLPAPTGPDNASGLSGTWTDEYGTVYQIKLNGAQFSYRATFRNMQAARPSDHVVARGIASGSDLQYVADDAFGRHFTCEATVSADRQRIQEACRQSDGKLERVTLFRS